MIGYGHYAIATLDLIFYFAVRRKFHVKLALRFGLLEDRTLWAVHRSRKRADLGDFNSIEWRSRKRERRQSDAAIVQAGPRYRVERSNGKWVLERKRL